jgi:muramoyltetrapeptide carboxypeptidase
LITQPPYLQKGDTVLLIAPARSVTESDIHAFKTWTAEQGWNLEYAPNLFGVDHQFSGDDVQRSDDLEWAFSHPSAKAIFTARGGYGAMRTIESLAKKVGDIDKWLSNQKPKWFVGFSDMTTIHLWLNKNQWASVHGPVASQWGQKHNGVKYNVEVLSNLLRGKPTFLEVNPDLGVRVCPFSAPVIGGNLSLVYASLGTPFQPITEGKVLLLEDLDEYLYHVDRMIRSCKYAGLFNSIKALLVGSMIDMKDNAIPFGKTTREIIVEAVGDMGFPILFDVEIGHDQRNHAIKLGCDIIFDLSILSQNP